MPTTRPEASKQMTVSDVMVTCRLYIAGQAANSRYAVRNLKAFCEMHLPARHHIEIVDVSLDPERAMADRVFLTPTLAIVDPAPVRFIIGDLSDSKVLLQALGSEVSGVPNAGNANDRIER